jgi:hypothetical protein
MGKTAADGSPVANGTVGNTGSHFAQYSCAIETAVFKLGMGHASTDPPFGPQILDAPEALDACYVDQDLRRGAD